MRSLIFSLAAFCASLAVVLGVSFSTAHAAEVTLLAVENAGGPEVKGAIAWSVVKVNKETGKPEAKPTATGNGPRLLAQLDPGQYLVTAKLGKIESSQAIMVGKSATTRSLVLADPTKTASRKPEAGPPAQLSINMKLSKGKSPLKEPVLWEVYTYEKGGTDAGEKVAEQKAATGMFSLPGGSYVVRAHYKGTKADLVIPIEPGQSLKYTLNLYAGYVKLAALKPKKQKTSAEALSWQILRQRPNAPGVYELVTSSEKPNPTLMLREGRYLAVARLGNKLWGSEQIVITAGETATKKIDLKEGVGAPEVAAAN
ncbi:hypothetical protein [Dongia sp.]|uniref:hypothetical protein n=1 Tax=Dongia sp. TaxID=1977262 RepID=UPI0035B3716C